MRRIRDIPVEKPFYMSVLNLDGVDDYLNAGNNVSLQFSNAFTVSAVIIPLSLSGVQSIIAKHSASGATGTGFFLYLSNDKIDLYLFQGDGTFKHCLGSTLKINEKYHVVGMYDGLQIITYLNGVPGNLTEVTGFLPANDKNCRIGIYSYSGSSPFKGKIFNVKIWNSALTPDQIYSSFCGESITSNLVLHHDYTLGNAKDLSGNENNGTVIGATFIRQLSGCELIDPKVKR